MQNDLVERVARAMWERAHWGPWLEATPYEREPYLKGASAAFCAIGAAGYVVVPREPTPDMRLAGGMAWMKAYVDLNSADPIADACFKAMIDAALEKDEANVG